MTTEFWSLAALAQAAYAHFDERATFDALVENANGSMAPAEARELLGITEAGTLLIDGFNLAHDRPDDQSGFSASVFRPRPEGPAVLAIRGTSGAVDLAQDARLALVGFAGDQAVSMYRFYRELITPAGAPVQYTPADMEVLHKFNAASSPISVLVFGSGKTNQALDNELLSDRGIGVLLPGEPLIVTGHSLGAHLALLFGRLFPEVTQDIYAFNTPGITPAGEVLLGLMGIGHPNASDHVFNFIADYGHDVVSAFGFKSGSLDRIFIEGSVNPIANHSIVPLTDSLALYDLIAALSPGLDGRMSQIGSIIAGASRNPIDSLERTLDLLRGIVNHDGTTTPIAADRFDQTNRDIYYTRLYDLRDSYADRDWQIEPVAGHNVAYLINAAMGSAAWRYALATLSPFAALGVTTSDESLMSLSPHWIEARADFLAHLVAARMVDRAYAIHGGIGNELFMDVDRHETLAVLDPATTKFLAENPRSNELVLQYLDSLTYGSKTLFGSDSQLTPDSIAGTLGADLLFGNSGDDTLAGNGGDDLLEGGLGSDRLMGGDGFDSYVYVDALDADIVTDTDGWGTIEINGVDLTGGALRADGVFHSDNGLHTYELTGGDLVIDGELVIAEFDQGDLGIFLTGTPMPVDDGSAAILIGDFEIARDDPDPELQSLHDEYGNFLPVGGAAPGTSDIFYGLPGDTAIYPLAGLDFVYEKWGGNDWVEGGAGGDIVFGGPGDDVLFADASDSDLDGLPLDDSDPSFFPDEISGGDGADWVIGSKDRDFLEGGAGSDTVIGGNGSDRILGDGIAVFMQLEYGDGGWPIVTWSDPSYANVDAAGAGADEIDGGPGIDSIVGGSGNDTIDGGAGRDVLDGGPGDDLLITGADGATVYGDGALAGDGTILLYDLPYDPDIVGGNDTLIGDGSLYGQAGDDEIRGDGLLSGGTGDDTLLGGESSDTLLGGAGADYFDGGGGGDVYFVGDGDTIRVSAHPECFLVPDGAFPGALTLKLDQGIETVRLTEVASDLGTITALVLDFGAAVALFGSAEEWAGVRLEFDDGTVSSLADLQRSYQIDYTDFPEEITGLDGLFQTTAGDDAFSGGQQWDQYTVLERGGHDTIEDTGNGLLVFLDSAADDFTVFVDGADYLMVAADEEIRLVGQADPGLGIDYIAFAGDGALWTRSDIESHAIVLPEQSDEVLPLQTGRAGTDFTYALPEGLFHLERVLGEPAYLATTLDGSPLPEWLHFDAEHLVLSGTPGVGDAGVVTVALALADESEILALSPLVIHIEPAPEPIFTAGGDTVDFNALSADQLLGLEVTTDVYTALAGNDLVTLPDSTSAADESGFVLGTKFQSGPGHDTVVGARYAERIDGGAGNDRLLGGGSRDSLVGAAGNDVLLGQVGDDRLQGSLGKDVLDGGAGDDLLVGGPGSGSGLDDDVLTGRTGDDRLQGGIGTDKLTGGAGSDAFVFTTILDSASVLSKADTVIDFEQGSDRIDLTGIDAQHGAGNQAFHYVGSQGFHAAGDLHAYIRLNQTIIAGDVDGDGVADFRIKLSGAYALTAEDFVL